jgi:hypothetical protein
VSFDLVNISITGLLKNGKRLHVYEAGHLWLFEGMFV